MLRSGYCLQFDRIVKEKSVIGYSSYLYDPFGSAIGEGWIDIVKSLVVGLTGVWLVCGL